ncbi:MAG TPA: cytochrome P450 [Ktedonobacteraceae bacterium]|jgi:cytochrome P450
MRKQETVSWQIEETNAPPPPLAEPQGLAEEEGQFFMQPYRQWGPIFRVPQDDGRTMTVLAGSEANVLVARHGHELLASREFWEDFGKALAGEKNMDIALQRDGEVNRKRRAKSSAHYSRAKVLDQIPLMVEMVHTYTQSWPQGERFPLLPVMQRIVAEQLGQLLVHHEVGEYLQDFVTFLDTAIENALRTKNIQAFFDPAFLQARARTQELGRLILARRRAEPSDGAAGRKPDLLDHLLADAAQHPELYAEELLEQAGTGPFFAGIDTVAYTSSSMLYYLHENPQAARRVQEEVDAVFAHQPLEWEKVKNMQATHGAAMETLRLGNGQSGGGQRYRVVKPFTFAGYRLDVDDLVFHSWRFPHRLPELFPQPDLFDIDRYHAPRNEHRRPGAFAPFGVGDHFCLGAGIAEIQLVVNIATILHDYQVTVEFARDEPPDSSSPISSKVKQLRGQIVAR